MSVSKKKPSHPIAQKLLIIGDNKTIEIDIGQPEVVLDKTAFCIVVLAEHYVVNTSLYGGVEDFIKLLSKFYSHIDLATDKGNVLALNLTPYILKKLKNAIQGLIAINNIRNDKVLF